MKHKKILTMVLFLLIPFILGEFVSDVQAQGVLKQVPAGYLRSRVADSGDEGEGSMGWDNSGPVYWSGWEVGLFSSKGIALGAETFTDSLGTTFTPKISSHGQWENNDRNIIIPIPDEDGWTIHRTIKHPFPTITVDGLQIQDPYPFNLSDHVASEEPERAIPGTADMLIESFMATDMGISIHQETIYSTQRNHEKYHIRKWTFTNTGNMDNKPDVDVSPVQTLEGVYFLVQDRHQEWQRPMVDYYGDSSEDVLPLRILYGYPMRNQGATFDDIGLPDVDGGTGFLRLPWFRANAILYASAVDANFHPVDANDPLQPIMTGFQDVDLPEITVHSLNLSSGQQVNLYNLMKDGFSSYPINPDPDNDDPNILGGPNGIPSHHSVDLSARGDKWAYENAWWGYSASGFFAIGPYTLDPGESFTVTRCDILGSLSPEKSFEVGNAWLNGTLTWGDGVIGGDDDILPPNFSSPTGPELYASDAQASEQVNWAKDNWVMSGYDSMIQVASAAQWAHDNDWNVPEPPPPPSLTVTSGPDRILVEWGNESEASARFAGYRVYRARAGWYPHVPDDGQELVGVWERIHESSGSGSHSFDDVTAQRGISYYYYVVAYDDGSSPADFNGESSVLESSQFWNMTTQPATLQRPGGSLQAFKIVPNPYNFAGQEGKTRYPGDAQRNQIQFLDVPETCTIRIFTESGDLIKTIDHTGSGDASWGNLSEEYGATDEGQLIVSGIYIALVETPDGEQAFKKFVIIR